MSARNSTGIARHLALFLAFVLVGTVTACVGDACNTPECIAERESTQVADASRADATGMNSTAAENSSMQDESAKSRAMGDVASEEPVADAVMADAGISATVISTGCTRAEHFHVEHEIDDSVCRVTIVRDTPDLCRRAPMPVSLIIPWEQASVCGNLEMHITNPPLEAPRKMLKRELPNAEGADVSGENQ